MQRHEIIERLNSIFRGMKAIRELTAKHDGISAQELRDRTIVEPMESGFTISISFIPTKRGRRSLYLLLYALARTSKAAKSKPR